MTGQEIKIPDIGGATDVDVIEILVKVGDEISKDSPLVTLESDKASMEIPSPVAGKIESIKVKVGDKVSEGDVILFMTVHEEEEVENKQPQTSSPPIEEKKSTQVEKAEEKASTHPEPEDNQSESSSTQGESEIYAGPGVRRLAHTLGVNLAEINGSGRKARISKEDVERFVKRKLQQKSSATGLVISEAPQIDFSKFGPIDIKPLNKIKRLTGANVHRSWVTIPHVTQFDHADITELEAFRKAESAKAAAAGYKLTLLAFVCKVVTKALMAFPQFNTSLDSLSENVIYKKYYNIGIAVETPNGLVVPVIKDINQLSVGEIAQEMGRLSQKARDKGLMPTDMNGGCFTISSLGGIGGTAFTPIVNSPEVAILGLSRSMLQPIYYDGAFLPRLMLPLSLSYDHRVIDGAEAARFTRFISEALSDIRRILL